MMVKITHSCFTVICVHSCSDDDAGNGIHIVSQECCYNRQGNLLVGGPYGGSANAQPVLGRITLSLIYLHLYHVV